MPSGGSILTINAGSSSLKVAVFDRSLERLLTFSVERIGSSMASARRNDEATQAIEAADHAAALRWLTTHLPDRTGITAVGHRVVHGGADYMAPVPVNAELISDLRAMIPIDPQHMPQAIGAIESISELLPEVAQIACFDTWFHRTMPIESTLLPIPHSYYEEGVRRFGFHGLSYESIMRQFANIDPAAASGRVVIAHLGAGSSMVAVRDGASQDTTMGFTPTGGQMMGTRPGDLDPGLLLYLLQVRGMNADEISDLLNRQSGLLGISGSSQDMRDLISKEDSDAWAERAVALYCHLARKQLGGLIANLGGIETLIFTGGIGQNSPEIRRRICEGFGYPGIALDAANERNDAIITTSNAPVQIRVMAADEELAIARHTAALVAGG